ncbi:MAG: hypothetical protein ACTS27_09360 [Phycisphaerales bacterium]
MPIGTLGRVDDFDDPTNWSNGVPSMTTIAKFEATNPIGSQSGANGIRFNRDESICRLDYFRYIANTFSAGETARYTLTLKSTGTTPSDVSMYVAGRGNAAEAIGDARLFLYDINLHAQNGIVGLRSLLSGESLTSLRLAAGTFTFDGFLEIGGPGPEIEETNVLVLGDDDATSLYVGGKLKVGVAEGPGFLDVLGNAGGSTPEVSADAIEVDYGGIIQVHNGGTVEVRSGAILVHPNGTLRGHDGYFVGDVALSGILNPGFQSLNNAEVLEIDGDLIMDSDAQYLVKISSTTSDIVRADHVDIDGELNVASVASFDPPAGTVRAPLQFFSSSGAFDSVVQPAFGDCRTIKVRYCSDRVAIIVAGVPGDVNYDGVVNFTDQNAIFANFGQTGCVVTGDADFDGDVDFNDLNVVNSHLGQTCN